MNERPTPETDALDCELHTPRVLQDRYSEMRDHAQKLERERDEAREKMADALQEVDLRTLDYERMRQERDDAREALASREVVIAQHKVITELMLERDEARELLASEKITRNHIIQRSVEVERERDEARFLLKQAQSSLDAIHLEVGGWIKILKENTD